jgi:hypothetical protein
MLKVSPATACRKWLADPCIWFSPVSTYPRSCCDVLGVSARILSFRGRGGRERSSSRCIDKCPYPLIFAGAWTLERLAVAVQNWLFWPCSLPIYRTRPLFA